MKKTYIAALLAFSALAATSAQAATEKEGYYAGAGIGYSHVDVDAGGTNIDKTGFGFNAYGGYQFNNTFAAELGYSQLGDIKVPAGAGAELSVRNTMVSVSALAYYPATKDVNVFGRVGIADTKMDILGSKQSNVTGLVGIGAEYKLSSNYSLRGEVQYVPNFAGSDANVVNATAGLKVTF